jgi:hypothetical protein
VGPSGTVIAFNLAPGTDSSPIPVLPNVPIFVIGIDTTAGNASTAANAGVGFISLDYNPADGVLQWAGMNSPNSSASSQGVPIQGDSNTPNTTMVAISVNQFVTLVTGQAPGTFVIHNGTNVTQSGTVWILSAP